MPTSTMLRTRYMTDSVETMSPGRLIVAVYDRLMLDFDRAIAAIERRDVHAAHGALVHAQDIVFELRHSLDTTKWAAGNQLAAIYDFVLDGLIAANVRKDANIVRSCATIIEPLRDAWRQAAGVVTSAPPAA
jgi:flagellar protein FliS